MSITKMALLAAGLALGLTTAGITTKVYAQAQNTPGNMLTDLGEDEVIMISPSGKMVKHKIVKGQGKFAKMQKMGAREIKGGAIVKRGGKIYLLEDKPGKAAGKTMMQEEFQSDFDMKNYY
jgi:hypothetical protein